MVYILITHTVHTSKNESIDVGVFFICFEAKANASLGIGGGFVLRVKPN